MKQRCGGWACIGLGVVLFALAIFSQIALDANQHPVYNPTTQEDIPTILHISDETSPVTWSPTTTADACLDCHTSSQPAELATSNTPRTLSTVPPSATFRDRFEAMGHRLLTLDYKHDERFSEPIRRFWQIHEWYQSPGFDTYPPLAMIAELEMVEEQFDLIYTHVHAGTWQQARMTNTDWTLALLNSRSRLSKRIAQASALSLVSPNYSHLLYEEPTRAPQEYLMIAERPRGPPAMFVDPIEFFEEIVNGHDGCAISFFVSHQIWFKERTHI